MSTALLGLVFRRNAPSHLLHFQFLFFTFLVGLTAGPARAQVTVYPAPANLAPSEAYRVEVNGKPVFVYQSPVPAAYCSFDMVGPVEIVVKANRDVRWVDVRPLSAGIKATFKDSLITIRLDKPAQLSIELNGSIKTPLFVFANGPETDKPKKNDRNVRYFEGGKVHYPGIITLKSNQSVYVEGGAVVVGVVKAKGAKNVKVYGRGVLDGTYNRNFNDSLVKTKPADQEVLRVAKGTYQRFLEFIDCEQVTLAGVTLHNSTTWQVVPINCQNVRIDDLKIISDQASDDGIDVVRSRDVQIRNSFIRTTDDCIVVKAHLNYPRTVVVDGLLVEGCTLWNALWGNAIEIGFELNAAEVKNITFRDIDIIHVEAGAVLSIHNAGTGHVRNVLFEDIRIEDARQKLFDLAIFRSRYSEDGTRDQQEIDRLYLHGAWDGVLHVPESKRAYHAQFRGNISNITFRNIQITDGLFPYSVFHGFDQSHNIKDVTIDHLVVHGKKIRNKDKTK
ncbi:hypothetical protein BH24BAC1_BH24BAC1_17790 [soil metagenome]